LIARLPVAKKSKKAKRGVPTRKKKRTKKATPAKKKTVMKKPEPRPPPITLAPSPLLRSFGGKTEDQ
jgi:hypothetical protein